MVGYIMEFDMHVILPLPLLSFCPFSYLFLLLLFFIHLPLFVYILLLPPSPHSLPLLPLLPPLHLPIDYMSPVAVREREREREKERERERERERGAMINTRWPDTLCY